MPNFRLNLLSGSFFDKQGYDSLFSNGTWKMSKGSLVIARGHTCGTLSKTHMKICENSINIVEGEKSQNLWHQRLGHMSEKGLSTLTKKKLIKLTKDATLDPCSHCLFGKQHRVSFNTSSLRKSELLDLIHSDVCGPLEVESLGANMYFLPFIDDASRKVWVYFLKERIRFWITSRSFTPW